MSENYYDFLTEMHRYADLGGTIFCRSPRFLLTILRRSIYYTTTRLPLFNQQSIALWTYLP